MRIYISILIKKQSPSFLLTYLFIYLFAFRAAQPLTVAVQNVSIFTKEII